jgi:hypothetical protein
MFSLNFLIPRLAPQKGKLGVQKYIVGEKMLFFDAYNGHLDRLDTILSFLSSVVRVYILDSKSKTTASFSTLNYSYITRDLVIYWKTLVIVYSNLFIHWIITHQTYAPSSFKPHDRNQIKVLEIVSRWNALFFFSLSKILVLFFMHDMPCLVLVNNDSGRD